MVILGTIIIYLLVAAFAILELAETAYYFDKKKWGWFGISAYLAIYWTVWTIHHIFG